MTVRSRLLLALNHLFPRPLEYDDRSDESYSNWEFESGRYMFDRFFAGRVDIEGGRMLDLGCGTGGKASFYSTLSPASLIAVDMLEGNVGKARKFAAGRGSAGSLGFAAADAASLPFGGECFDVIAATDTFEHFADPLAVLAEISRVLAPGGRVIFYFTPHYSPLGSHIYDVIHLPWCHLVAGERVLFEAVETALLRDAEAAGGDDPAAAGRRAAEMREYYRKDLNRMTVRRFLRLIEGVPGLELEWFYRKPLKTRLLSPLTRIHPVGELVTTLAIGLLRKSRGTSR